MVLVVKRMTKKPFHLAGHMSSLPTRLADGLELESALIRQANLRPVEALNLLPVGSPVTVSGDAVLGHVLIVQHFEVQGVWLVNPVAASDEWEESCSK